MALVSALTPCSQGVVNSQALVINSLGQITRAHEQWEYSGRTQVSCQNLRGRAQALSMNSPSRFSWELKFEEHPQTKHRSQTKLHS